MATDNITPIGTGTGSRTAPHSVRKWDASDRRPRQQRLHGPVPRLLGPSAGLSSSLSRLRAQPTPEEMLKGEKKARNNVYVTVVEIVCNTQ